MLLYLNLNQNLLYLPIFMVANVVQYFNEKSNINEVEHFYSFISYLSQIFLIIFYFIEKYLSKNKLNKDNNLFKVKYYVSNSKLIILIIFLLIFNSIKEYIINAFETNKKEDFMIFVFFFIILEKFIFKINFYHHQIILIIIVCFSLLYYFILNIIQSNLELLYILYFLFNYSKTFTLVLIKYINTQYFIDIFLLSFILGLFETIQFLIKFYNNISLPVLNLNNILNIILTFIIKFITGFLMFIIISKLSPLHNQMIYYTTLTIIEIIVDKENKNYSICDCIIFGLCIISSLIYLEILKKI